MKKLILIVIAMLCYISAFAAPPPRRHHDHRENDGLRTTNGILNLIDKALHIFSWHSKPTPVVVTPAPVVVTPPPPPAPVVVAPAPVVVAPAPAVVAPAPAVVAPPPAPVVVAPAAIHHYPDEHPIEPVIAPWHRPRHIAPPQPAPTKGHHQMPPANPPRKH